MKRSAAALLAAAQLAGGCGGGSAGVGASGSGGVGGSGLQGLILQPAKPAPPLVLRNYTGGAAVSLAALHGRAVFVTFVYTHCPDVCPLIVASLASAQRQLGSGAEHVRILAVTVDPRRDTPTAIRAFLGARDAVGRIDYLLGSASQLARTWKQWEVAVTTGRNRVTAGHSSVIYGITGSGRRAVVYPSNVTPAQIVHDVPLLVRS